MEHFLQVGFHEIPKKNFPQMRTNLEIIKERHDNKSLHTNQVFTKKLHNPRTPKPLKSKSNRVIANRWSEKMKNIKFLIDPFFFITDQMSMTIRHFLYIFLTSDEEI